MFVLKRFLERLGTVFGLEDLLDMETPQLLRYSLAYVLQQWRPENH